jgi:hypothetical protein
MGAELVPASSEVSPGEELVFRLVNHGPGPVGYGFPYEVQRKERRRWVEADVHSRNSVFPLPYLTMPPGGSREQAVSVRMDVPAGRYRVIKSVSVAGDNVMLSFEFNVVAKD